LSRIVASALALGPGLALAVGLGLAGAPAAAHDGAAAPAPPPVRADAPLFEPPPPGSYELPPIATVGEHVLLDSEGLPLELPGLAPGQVAVVSFVYGSCGQGCPAALATLQRLDRALAARPELARRVRLVTLSFDPGRDGPERMAELRHHLAPAADWRFATAPDPAALAPVLADYDQRVVPLVDAAGEATGLLRHVLKVFLVDESRRIRNVYSVGLMDPRLILNDVRTVLTETADEPGAILVDGLIDGLAD